MALVIEQGTIGKAPVLRLAGRVIENDSKKLATKLEALCKKGAKTVVIDVSLVELMDSRGLGSVMYFYTLLRKEGRKLVILNKNTSAAGYMYQLFEQTHLDQVLQIIADPEQL
jgi:anti-anti-sigma factor